MRYLALTLSYLTTAVSALTAQGVSLVHDINAMRTPLTSQAQDHGYPVGPIRFDRSMMKLGGYWYFFAITRDHGMEMWRTDGTAAGTSLFADINPGTEGSFITRNYMVKCDGKLFFKAFEPTHGWELWMTDGTAKGTKMVADILPGPLGSNPEQLAALGSCVLFSASDVDHGRELWKTDGTLAGTVLVKDINPFNSRLYRSGMPYGLTRMASGDRIVFGANDGTNGREPWVTDGTTAGTFMLKNIRPGGQESTPIAFLGFGAATLFRAYDAIHGSELWKTDGTSAGTTVIDIVPGPAGSYPELSRSIQHDGGLYFAARDARGIELWRTDATRAGTELVCDVNPGPGSGDPFSFAALGSDLYFTAYDQLHGAELRRWDGSRLHVVADIYPGSRGSYAGNTTRVGAKLFFSAGGLDGRELWCSDGTTLGTYQVKDIHGGTLGTGSPGGSSPRSLTPLSSTRLMFFAESDLVGRELFESDGTEAGTRVLKDIYPGDRSFGSNPAKPANVDGSSLYFQAHDGVVGAELWKTEPGGSTRLVKDIRPGIGSSDPGGFTTCFDGARSFTVFEANDYVTARFSGEPWVTDGTSAGTFLLCDVRPGIQGSFPRFIACYKGRVYFSANDGSGYQLWVTNGTVAGTMRFKDISPSFGSDGASSAMILKGKLVFSAGEPTGGSELWSTDGTPAGTERILDLNPGPSSSSPNHFARLGDEILFAADVRGMGRELFKTDGTAGGTRLLKDIAPGFGSSVARRLTECAGKVFLVAHDGVHGHEIWKTDGTEAGTVLVADVNPGRDGSYSINLVASGDHLFFVASETGTNTDRELFVSDGTAKGTKLMLDLAPGIVSSDPAHLVSAGRGVYFSATTEATGRELFYADATKNKGIRLVCDLQPGDHSSSPTDLIVCEGVLYFSADGLGTGSELYRVDGSPGTVERLGEGCGPTVPRIRSTIPLLHERFTVSGDSAPAGPAMLVLGIPGGPRHTAGLVAPECAVWWSSPLVQIPIFPSGSTWSLTTVGVIPGRPSIEGTKILLQATYGSSTLALSNGLQIVIGSQSRRR